MNFKRTTTWMFLISFLCSALLWSEKHQEHEHGQEVSAHHQDEGEHEGADEHDHEEHEAKADEHDHEGHEDEAQGQEEECLHEADDAHDHEEQDADERVELPASVRQNLRITFAPVQHRAVASTLHLPGRFELQPAAQQHYPVPVAGRVNILVHPLQKVKKGDVILHIDAPEWGNLKMELLQIRADRLKVISEQTQTRLSRMAAGNLTPSGPDVYGDDLRAKKAELELLNEHEEILLSRASSITGLSVKHLKEGSNGEPLWKSLGKVPVHAVDEGVVRQIDAATGTWIPADREIVHVVNTNKMLFQAKALQSDLVDHLRDGQSVSIPPPRGRGPQRQKSPLKGEVRIGVTGDPQARTVDIFVDLGKAPLPPWVRPKVSAIADVFISGDPDEETLAIPVRAVIQDGLEKVFFRRKAGEPDAVYRTRADLGASDGRFVTVHAGLAEGDEVVVDGVYQLKLATTGQEVKAGHFHSDGTFHDGEH